MTILLWTGVAGGVAFAAAVVIVAADQFFSKAARSDGPLEQQGFKP